MFKPLLAWCFGLSIIIASTSTVAAITIIPKPQQMDVGEGSYRLDAHTGIDAPKSARVQKIVTFLRDSIHEQTGIELSHSLHAHGIVLAFDPTVKGDEAYRLMVTPRGVVIQASSDKGLFWGVQTLRQLLPLDHASSIDIPAVNIKDAPAFAYRGFMLDVGRHFFPVSFIKKQLDLLSYYKINTFHWHLTEDQGWRIQIRRYPKLTDVGAWRTEEDGSHYGGFYTQNDIRDVIDYARERNIMVVPEIEMPGHSTAALAAYPEYSCTKQPLTVAHTWGVFKDIYCVGNPQTFTFLQHVLDEVIALFPSPYVHIGGDEAPKDRWKACETCQALMHEQGLKDEEGLQSYFVKHFQSYLESKGKTMIGWDEILEGGADKNAIVEVWRMWLGNGVMRKALLNGNRIIMAGPFYLDSPLDVLTVKSIYQTDITKPASPSTQDDDELFAEHHAQILGGEAPLWSERANPFNAESKIYPRMLAFAENLWTGKHDDAAYADFEQRLQAQYPWLDTQKVAYGPEKKPVVAYAIDYDAQHGDWQLHAKRGFDDLQNHYTEDSVDPSAQSPSFDDEVDIHQAGALKIVPYRNGLRYDNATRFTLVHNLASGHTITLAQPPDTSYAPASALVDGVLGTSEIHDGRWVAWHDSNLDATIDLQKDTAIHAIDVGFLQAIESRVLLPENVTFLASSDGQHWTTLYTHAPAFDPTLRDGMQRFRFQPQQPVTARYIRIEADQRKTVPASFSDGAKDIWLFTDEMVVQ
ncbi:glycoside hydrolase family 20 protein [Dyella nitratireducens]|uniref:beta-N-acetylhexosaminidase n=1 Tax=Dyella nitratireducens TaxID=1849580 RepID=A0ABQ1GFX6_9GAMM|nr:family 20 glycosylhydrolase [Dyella nitratireducens]GGA42863.1 beta-N-acetylhexosaminidase [Dyella nitratireducens]GLQ41947.1 beta-N-acetylhexosaminidase [Dyella nitratireducens]